jgi:hypothetical protein
MADEMGGVLSCMKISRMASAGQRAPGWSQPILPICDQPCGPGQEQSTTSAEDTPPPALLKLRQVGPPPLAGGAS